MRESLTCITLQKKTGRSDANKGIIQIVLSPVDEQTDFFKPKQWTKQI
jgi:hypothetical protein